MTGTASYIVEGVLARHDPAGEPRPVVLDSPHSGRDYPEDFGHSAPFAELRRAEDSYVDELFAEAPSHGAALLAALFPRSYIDPNRHETDIEPALLAEPWPDAINPTERSRRGLGLIRSLVSPALPVYDRRLAVAEVARRIERYHRPYHAELRALIDGAASRFGAVWHLNCHSMRAHGRERGGDGDPRADIVLSDGDGTTCEAEFTAFVGRTLEAMGYTVRLNDPFKGAEIVNRYSDPLLRRHSLQIEVNRRLYLDDATLERNDGFAALASNLGRLVAALADYARERAGITAGTARAGSAPRDCVRDRREA